MLFITAQNAKNEDERKGERETSIIDKTKRKYFRFLSLYYRKKGRRNSLLFFYRNILIRIPSLFPFLLCFGYVLPIANCSSKMKKIARSVVEMRKERRENLYRQIFIYFFDINFGINSVENKIQSIINVQKTFEIENRTEFFCSFPAACNYNISSYSSFSSHFATLIKIYYVRPYRKCRTPSTLLTEKFLTFDFFLFVPLSRGLFELYAGKRKKKGKLRDGFYDTTVVTISRNEKLSSSSIRLLSSSLCL